MSEEKLKIKNWRLCVDCPNCQEGYCLTPNCPNIEEVKENESN